MALVSPSVLQAPAHWQTVDFIADLHLQPTEPATVEAWAQYMRTSVADAIFILGDFFEVWVGYDAAQDPQGFGASCAAVLRAAAAHQDILFMRGNRDFLIGPAFLAQAQVQDLADPTLLRFQGQSWLLTHGDALCLDDVAYQQARQMLRSPQWQADFLARPLPERLKMAQGFRQQSQAHHQTRETYADVDAEEARRWLHAADTPAMIHGHTHRPADHELGAGLRRHVLSDWDAAAQPPRLEVLRLNAGGLQRISLI